MSYNLNKVVFIHSMADKIDMIAFVTLHYPESVRTTVWKIKACSIPSLCLETLSHGLKEEDMAWLKEGSS
jgi:hypothetical protein